MPDARREQVGASFPDPIKDLPRADLPIPGATAYLSQSDSHQVLFMEFDQEVELPEHSHGAQVGVVLAGSIVLVIDGVERCFTKGDRYYIPAGVSHSGRIHAGYCDISFFAEPDRYKVKRGAA